MIVTDDASTMPLQGPLEAALLRFSAALDRLQVAANQRIEAGAAIGGDPVRVSHDQARLAPDLDAALARAERLADAQAEVLTRLDRAEATIQTVIAGLGSAADANDEDEEA